MPNNRCVLFRAFAPTGQDSIAQGAALGYGTTTIGKPQRGVTPRRFRRSFAPLGLALQRGFVTQGCALGFRVSTLRAGKHATNPARSIVLVNLNFSSSSPNAHQPHETTGSSRRGTWASSTTFI